MCRLFREILPEKKVMGRQALLSTVDREKEEWLMIGFVWGCCGRAAQNRAMMRCHVGTELIRPKTDWDLQQCLTDTSISITKIY